MAISNLPAWQSIPSRRRKYRGNDFGNNRILDGGRQQLPADTTKNDRSPLCRLRNGCWQVCRFPLQLLQFPVNTEISLLPYLSSRPTMYVFHERALCTQVRFHYHRGERRQMPRKPRTSYCKNEGRNTHVRTSLPNEPVSLSHPKMQPLRLGAVTFASYVPAPAA